MAAALPRGPTLILRSCAYFSSRRTVACESSPSFVLEANPARYAAKPPLVREVTCLVLDERIGQHRRRSKAHADPWRVAGAVGPGRSRLSASPTSSSAHLENANEFYSSGQRARSVPRPGGATPPTDVRRVDARWPVVALATSRPRPSERDGRTREPEGRRAEGDTVDGAVVRHGADASYRRDLGVNAIRSRSDAGALGPALGEGLVGIAPGETRAPLLHDRTGRWTGEQLFDTLRPGGAQCDGDS